MRYLFILPLIAWTIAEMQGAWLNEPIQNPYCLIDNDISWLYVRGLLSNGNIDNNAIKTLNETKALRLDRRIYINPTMKLNPEVIAEKLCNELIKGLNEKFHIYVTALYDPNNWSNDPPKNIMFIEKLRDEIVGRKECFGSVNILSRKFDWEKLFGREYTQFSSRVLIWHRTDGDTCDPSKFVPFGGWKRVDGIVYKHNTPLCGNNIDISCLLP